jgi:hypothetical protein
MAKSNKSRRQSSGGNGASATATRNDAETLLKQDHRTVEKLFKQFEGADGTRKKEIATQICRELVVHTLLEEELFYPACREKGVEDDALDEAQVEHDSVKLLVAELASGQRDPFYDAKMTVLSEYVKHHVKEEEKRGSGIFAKARKAGVDMAGLGSRLQELKQRIEEDTGPDGIPASRPRALRLQSGMFNQRQQETFMARERDERGRFMDEDDDRGGRGGRGHGRGGWFGDPEGHSRAGQQRGSSSGRYQDDDDYGGRGSGRGQGRGGWFGDSEGHSRAAQQRGSSSGRYEDDDYGSRGGSRGGQGSSFGRERDEQGRFMSDDDDRGGRGGGGRGYGRGGWFGDSEGHSRAAQQRGSSSGRYRDDDDDGRGQGRGGWFGDPRGHSEASRRGWRDRD